MIDDALGRCPGLIDELKQNSDRQQALAGSTMGPIGERLDDALRAGAIEQLEVRVLEPRERIVLRGQPVPGLVIVGVGALELAHDGAVEKRLLPAIFSSAARCSEAGLRPRTRPRDRRGASSSSANATERTSCF